MKKYILLFRHGIAEDADTFKWTDFERPLTKEWKKEVQSISKFLKKNLDIKIQAYISSPAIRAKQTIEVLIKTLKKDATSRLNENLYMKWAQAYIDSLEELDDSVQSVCICWHNPDISRIITKLCQENCISMEKGSVAILSLKKWVSWKEITSWKCKLHLYITPNFLSLTKSFKL